MALPLSGDPLGVLFMRSGDTASFCDISADQRLQAVLWMQDTYLCWCGMFANNGQRASLCALPRGDDAQQRIESPVAL